MAEFINQIKLPNNITYDIQDRNALPLSSVVQIMGGGANDPHVPKSNYG